MNNMIKISLATIMTIGLSGCGSNDNEIIDITNELKVLDRDVQFLTDTDGMTLYTFDKDAPNVSNCDAECLKIWPPFVGANTESEDLKVLEGTDHLTYKSHPLYYFIKDENPNDILGNNVKNVWDLVYAIDGSTDSQTKLSDITINQKYLTDKDGVALYSFDNDDINMSNCYDTTPTSNEGCETSWPIFYSSNLGILPLGTTSEDFATIDRDTTKIKEGEPTQQITYQGKPLYYFAPDNKEYGSIKGDWAKGVWHLIKIEG